MAMTTNRILTIYVLSTWEIAEKRRGAPVSLVVTLYRQALWRRKGGVPPINVDCSVSQDDQRRYKRLRRLTVTDMPTLNFRIMCVSFVHRVYVSRCHHWTHSCCGGEIIHLFANCRRIASEGCVFKSKGSAAPSAMRFLYRFSSVFLSGSSVSIDDERMPCSRRRTTT